MTAALAAPDLTAIAGRLLGMPVLALDEIPGGRNNRLFRVRAAGATAALKLYHHDRTDPRDRLAQEFGALSFLSGRGIDAVPRPIASDAANRCALYEWIEGIRPATVDADSVDALADFFLRLQALRTDPPAGALPPASASCFSVDGVLQQMTQRLERLRAAAPAEVRLFVEGRLLPSARGAAERARDVAAHYGIALEATLAADLRVFSPSDFGVHNVLRRPDGRLAFLDFEYFGWDDPAKAIVDVILHPGMTTETALTDALAARYVSRVLPALAATDHALPARIAAMAAPLQAIWAAIALNLFLPGAAAVGDAATRARQIEVADRILARDISGLMPA